MKTVTEMAREADTYATNEYMRLRDETICEEYLDVNWHELRDERFAELVRADERARMAEQKSGIKQVIELYDSPEKPAPVAKPHEQEPLACANGCRGFVKYPAQSKPLTDEQWQSIADTLGCIITRGQKDAIEATLGIKENT